MAVSWAAGICYALPTPLELKKLGTISLYRVLRMLINKGKITEEMAKILSG